MNRPISRSGSRALGLGIMAAAAIMLATATAEARPRHDHHGGHRGSSFSVHIGYGPGYFVPRLPLGYARVGVGGMNYFYSGGIFYGSAPRGYVMVGAPIGAVVHTLPPAYEVVMMGPATYYQSGAAWYSWDPGVGGYRVVSPPPAPPDVGTEYAANEVYFYPARGQDERQQEQDRYECHRWAVGESRFDPSVSQQPDNVHRYKDYQRAITACLVGRGYTAG